MNYITIVKSMRKLLCVLLCFGSAAGETFPQKVMTRFEADTVLPPGLKWSTEATVKASDGAMWERSVNGLYRRDSVGPERDRIQYFAGKRYLADDDVTALAPDSNGGVWVRTRTGISHIEYRP